MTTHQTETKSRWAALIHLGDALGGALQWRLLLLWTLGLLLPTAMVAVPGWQLIASYLDHSPRAATLASAFDALAFTDLVVGFTRNGPPLLGSSLLATLCAIFLSPFLCGVTLTAARSERAPGLGPLLHGALAWYWRMFRMLLVSLVPLGLVAAVGVLTFGLASERAARVVLESQAKWGTRLAGLLTLLVFLFVHVTLEAGRAHFAADARRQSAWRAWFRGVQLTFRRPMAVFGIYLGATSFSLIVAAALLLLRVRMSADNTGRFAQAFLLTQLGVAALGWGRASRLFALTAMLR